MSYLHGVCILLGVVGFSCGGVREDLFSNHGNLGGCKATEVIILIFSPLLTVARSRLRWIF